MTHVTIQPVDAEKASLAGLFEARQPIYQAKVKGTFRYIKYIFMAVLLGLYYVLPWVRWHRGPGAPDQAVLIDIIGRKFYFFFIELWPQEIYYFTGLLLLAALGLFFATTLFGRVWCGYACPQTVWTDLFFHVERWFEGDRNAQIKLASAPWSLRKVSKKLGKHITWLFIGLLTGGAWVFYFNDAPTLWHSMAQGQFSFAPTFWIVFLTFSTYLMAGFAREQVCTYMCPYARFQGAMFDEDSLIVTYNQTRGEPRGNTPQSGDCIDCNRCVAVCPVGIDIRDGQQYRCINCGLCVDACNAVMTKMSRTPNLIQYNTLNGSIPASAGLASVARHARFVRPRTVYYATIMALVGGAMLWAILHRPLIDLNVLHQRNPLYVLMSNGNVRNVYTVRLINKTWQLVTYQLTASTPGMALSTADIPPTPQGGVALSVKPGRVAEYIVFADLPMPALTGTRQPLTLTITGPGGKDTYTTFFSGPQS